VNLIVMVKNAS